MTRPQDDEYAPYLKAYADLVAETDILPVLDAQMDEVRRLAAGVAKERETFAYEPGKWSIRQVLGHIGDGERVFGYRAFCISRSDPTPLPAFDENTYVERSRSHATPLAELADDFTALRKTNVRMLASLEKEQWSHAGVANGKRITVRALAYVMAGHVRHHLQVLRERYGVALTAKSQPSR